MDVLPLEDLLLLARKRPVGFSVAHAGLARAREEIPVGDVQVNPLTAAPVVELGDRLPLHPVGVVKTLVARVRGGRADIARIGAVVLEGVEAGLLEESLELSEIGLTPLAAEARAAPE